MSSKASTGSSTLNHPSQIKPYHYSSYQPLFQSSSAFCKCNKFLPQLFNANKCQQCFNMKEMHSLEALAEFSKSNRKVCKYSYLFIAPPDLELNKTKRWQWRFFIFHDDGELTYSLDENPLTLPQGRINMCKCEEIIELNINNSSHSSNNNNHSSSLVSYPYSLRLSFSPPNKDIYIAAGNYEEISKWKDILSLYCCKRSIHKTESTPIGKTPSATTTENTNKKTVNTKNYKISAATTKVNKPINLDEFESIDDIDDIEDDLDLDDEEKNNADLIQDDGEDYDEEYDDDELDEDEYEYDENEFTTVRIKNSSNLKPNGDSFYNYNYPSSKNQSLSTSSSSSSSSSNLNRNRNESLKLKMMSGIKKSKSKNKLLGNNNQKVDGKSVDLDQVNNIVAESDEGNNKVNNNNNEETNSSNDTSINNETSKNSNETSGGSAPGGDGVDLGNANNNRRLSYKEDDLVRKQRLKDNLNQLLIEYKHEEEQHLKKSSKFNSLNNNNGAGNKSSYNHRVSLDSSYPTANNFSGYNKSSAFSLVIPPNQLMQQNNHQHSAFKPIVKTGESLPIKIQTTRDKSKTTLNSQHQTTNKIIDTNPTKSQLQKNISSNIETSSSSQSSWTSTSSSSSSSSSKSPPKTRPIQLAVNDQTTHNYNKPCLISPRKSSLQTDQKSESVIIKENSPSPQSTRHRPKNSFGTLGSNTSGYLWKHRDSSTKSTSQSNLSQLKLSTTYHTENNDKFEKFWFSLNTSLCCLIYWNDKYEQDLGKFPLGKYELAKCCQVVESIDSEFKVNFHQNSGSITLKATSMEKKLAWVDSLKHTIDNLANICTKCKPKLIVNPMVNNTNNLSNQTGNTTVLSSPQQQQSSPMLAGGQASAGSSEYFQQQEQIKEANYLKKQQQVSQKAGSFHTQSIKNGKKNTTIDNPIDSPESSSSPSPSTLTSTSSQLNSTLCNNKTDVDTLRQKNDKLSKETTESNRKFKLLEQIHLDAVSEFDKQQNLMYNQLEEMTAKLNQSEFNQEQLKDTHTDQLRNLNEQICKYKEKCKQQDQEIESLNKRIEGFNISFGITNNENQLTEGSGWNKEVKNLDARITDVLGKLREREKNLKSPLSAETDSNNQMQLQLQEAQIKIATLSGQLLKQQQQSAQKPVFQEFSDDLAKVLMSKEEVITQLEKQLKDKEKDLQELTDQLNEEQTQSNKVQTALNSEQDKNSILNSDLINQANKLHSTYTDEIDDLKLQVANVNLELESVQVKLAQTLIQNDSLSSEIKNSVEYNRNEQESLQEEIKTLEYKLVHSQRQAQEYQSILEDMDLANSNTINFIQKVQTSNQINSFVNEYQEQPTSQSTSIQNKLKRNQFQVQLLIQQCLGKQIKEMECTVNALDKTRSELNDLKEENTELNDHIYSIDVFMREKDQQCDQYQKEKEELSLKMDQKLQELNELKQNSETAESNSELISKANIKKLRSSLKKLIKFVSSSELMQFNSQIVSYMAEQLVHKSALNGNLKFACEVLKKKAEDSINAQMNNCSLLIECKKLNSNQQSSPSSSSDNNSYLPPLSTMNVQDDKIFKLASELLLSDDNSLRKLSSQVLNEAQHLTQLNVILNTLRKIRWKHLKLKTKEKLEQTVTDLDQADKENGREGSSGKLSESDDEDETDDSGEEQDVELEEEKLDYILNVIKDVFIEHKCQISEQLTEVQKIMSMSADDDLLTHLQTENSILQEELQKFKCKSLTSDKKATNNSMWLAGNTSPPSNTGLSSPYSSGATSLRKFNSTVPLTKSSPTTQSLDSQTQDDTVC